MARGSATVGALNVSLGLNSADFQNGIKRAETGLSGFALKAQGVGKQLGGLRNSISGVTNMLGPLAAATTAAGLLQFARDTISTTATLGDFSDQLGVSAESLQRLRFAARQTGSDADALDDGLRAMLGALADADEGAGGAGEEFKRLGINVREADGSMKSADKVLLELADALKGASSQSERAALAAKILGEDSGPRLAGLLAQGREGIERLGAAAPVLSDAMVKAAQETDAEWAKFVNNLTVNVQNAILGMVRLARTAAELSPIGQKIGRIREDLAKAQEQFATRQAIDEGKLGNIAGIPSAEFLERRIEALKKVLAEAQADPANIILPDTTQPRLKPLEKPGSSKGKGTRDKAKTEAERQADAIAAVVDNLRFEQEQLGRTSDEQAAANALRTAGIDANHASAQSIIELSNELERLRALHGDIDAVLGNDEAFGLDPQAIDKVADSVDYMNVGLGFAADGMRTLSRGFTGWKAIALDALGQVIDELVRMNEVSAAGGKGGKAGIIGQLFNLGMSFLGGGGAPLNLGTGSGAAGGVGSFIPAGAGGGSSFGFGGHYSEGGMPPVGKWSVVGEEGPEIIRPGTTNTVLPNSALGSMGGGQPESLHVSVAASEEFEVKVRSTSRKVATEVVTQRAPQIIKDSVRATYASATEHPIR